MFGLGVRFRGRCSLVITPFAHPVTLPLLLPRDHRRGRKALPPGVSYGRLQGCALPSVSDCFRLPPADTDASCVRVPFRYPPSAGSTVRLVVREAREKRLVFGAQGVEQRIKLQGGPRRADVQEGNPAERTVEEIRRSISITRCAAFDKASAKKRRSRLSIQFCGNNETWRETSRLTKKAKYTGCKISFSAK